MNRTYQLIFSACCLLTLAGCKQDLTPGADVAHATLVTYDQFRLATKDEQVFWYLGGDAKFQYFRTKNGFFRMATSTEYFTEKKILESKNKFESGIKIGEHGQNVMIRESGRIGAPAPGVDPNLPYPPVD